MIPWLSSSWRVPRSTRHDRRGIQRADAVVAPVARRTQRTPGCARRVSRRSGPLVCPSPAAPGRRAVHGHRAHGARHRHGGAADDLVRRRDVVASSRSSSSCCRGCSSSATPSACSRRCFRRSGRLPACSGRLRTGRHVRCPRKRRRLPRRPRNRPPRPASRARPPTISGHGGGRRHHRGRRASAAAKHRRLRGHAGARDYDASPGHCRDSG